MYREAAVHRETLPDKVRVLRARWRLGDANRRDADLKKQPYCHQGQKFPPRERS
jgi:hypothetical protein